MFAYVFFADPSGFYGSYSENMKEKTDKSYLDSNWAKKKKQFGANADIYIMKFCCLKYKSMRSL